MAEQRAAVSQLSAQLQEKAQQCADLEDTNGRQLRSTHIPYCGLALSVNSEFSPLPGQLSHELQSCQCRLEAGLRRVGVLEGEAEVCQKELQERAGLVGQLRQQLQEMEVSDISSQLGGARTVASWAG